MNLGLNLHSLQALVREEDFGRCAAQLQLLVDDELGEALEREVDGVRVVHAHMVHTVVGSGSI